MNSIKRRTPRTSQAAALLAVLLLGLTALHAQDDARPITIQPVPESPASPFLLKETDVRTWVTGPVAHVEVTQTWHNPNTVPVDGLYIFPLPEKAAVNAMSLRIGDRLIRGDMKRREEARRIYERARDEGRVAGLLDQERPNIFSQQVANIMPGEKIDVILAFDHEITCEDSSCEYVFPTVVGPRFIPASQPDPGRIDPPVVAEGSRTGQKLRLYVNVNGGVPIHDIQSPTHRVRIDRLDEAQAEIHLASAGGALLNRDFKLHWSVGGDRPELGILAWRDPREADEPGVFTIILEPPMVVSDEEAVPRELVFVLDCSGSMSGVPIEAAKNVVRKAIRAVRPQDTFQIIRFSENASGLGREPLEPTPENIRKALAYLDSLRGSGGTHMMAGIQAALGRPADPERLRIVAFLTDGYIGNEDQIFLGVRSMLAEARIFSFGIGSSVNRHLLEGLAEEGRGVAAFLGPREKPDEMVDRFIKRIDTPVLTDIRLSFDDVEVRDLEPAHIPDLFAGQSLLIHGRYTKPGTGLLTVEAKRRGEPVTMRKVALFLEREEDNEALGRLWARARIHRLERSMRGAQDTLLKESITLLGLRHHLMTPFTSLVAVDSLVSNLTGHAESVEVPVEMPEDVSYEGIFGRSNASAMNAGLRSIGNISGVAGGHPGGVFAAAPPPPGSPGVARKSATTEVRRVAATQHSAGDSSTSPAGSEFIEGLPVIGRNYQDVAGIGQPRDEASARQKEKVAGSEHAKDARENAQADNEHEQGGVSSTDGDGNPGGNGPGGRMAGRKDEGSIGDLKLPGETDESVTFARITLVEADGTEILIQGDGDLFVTRGGRRTMMRVLAPEELERLAYLVTKADLGSTPSIPPAGARLEVFTPEGGRIISLSGMTPILQDLAAMIRSLI